LIGIYRDQRDIDRAAWAAGQPGRD